MTDDHKRKLDAIRKTSDKLCAIAKGYDRLRWMAEQGIDNDAFINLALAAGEMTLSNLNQLSLTLEILFHAEDKDIA